MTNILYHLKLFITKKNKHYSNVFNYRQMIVNKLLLFFFRIIQIKKKGDLINNKHIYYTK